ncbi:MAG: hypothetical protein V3T72_21435 [Thermoanaerobaculia bacterium]
MSPPTDVVARRSARRALLWVAFLALVVRLLYLAEHVRSAFFGIPILDEKYYDVIARALVAGQDFSAVNPGFRPLLYPLFLAFSYRLGGDSGIALAVVAQHLLGALTAVLVAALAVRLHRRASAGAAAGVLYLLAGPPLFFEGELLITSLFTFLVTVLLWILSRAEAVPPLSSPVRRGALWLAAGLWIGLAAQARPNALLFLAAFPAAAFIWRRGRTGAALAARLLLPLAGAAAVLLAFAVVQWKLVGHFQLLPSSGGINFYLGNKLGADGMVPRQDQSVTYGEEYRDSVEVFATTVYLQELERDGVPPSAEPPSPGRISRYWLRRASGEIRRDPGRWLALMGRKLLYLVWSYEIPNNKSFAFIREHESDLLNSLPVRWWLLLALAAVGAAAARDRRLTFWIAAFLVLHAAGIVLFFVNSRYRVPMWPALAVLAGGALPAIIDALRAHRPRKLAVYAATFLAVAVLSLVGWAGVEPPGYSREFFFRSLAYFEKGDLERARADAVRSLEIDPEDPAAHFQLGNVALAAGDDLVAYESYLAAASRAPDEPRIFNNLGIVYERRSLPADAYRAYQVALALAPDYGPALVNAALLELRAGLLERAEDKLEGAAASGFEALPLLCAQAFLARERGWAAEARELLDEARRRDAEAAARLEQRQRQRLSAEELGVRSSDPPG